MTQEYYYGKDQAAAQYSSIVDMLAALSVDYDRLETLEDLESDKHLDAEELTELDELRKAANGCTASDEAQETIWNDALSVQLRSGWYSPGETPEAEEAEILLCTGGPAVRVMVELGEHKQPSRAYMQYQDWGTPWTDYYIEGCGAILLEYASQFYFGE